MYASDESDLRKYLESNEGTFTATGNVIGILVRVMREQQKEIDMLRLNSLIGQSEAT